MNKRVLAFSIVGLLLAAFVKCAGAQTLDPLVDYRYAGEVVRDADGKTARSAKVIRAFKKAWACPSTGKHSGPCPGWAIDHTIPLACGGVDAVYNMAWIPDAAKSCDQEYCKDRYERKVYGGNELSEGCP